MFFIFHLKKHRNDFLVHSQEWVFANQRPIAIVFNKFDIDQEPKFASVFGIQSIPAFLSIPTKGKPTALMGMMKK